MHCAPDLRISDEPLDAVCLDIDERAVMIPTWKFRQQSKRLIDESELDEESVDVRPASERFR
jgi:hypothetical protein